MPTSTATAPLGRPGEAALRDGSSREVLVGVDGSEIGLGAVRWAAREAVRRAAPLRLLHAAPYLGHPSGTGTPPPEMRRARRIMAQAYTAARHTEPDLRVSTEVVPGAPTAILLRAAAAGQLVVLGSSATGAPDELVLASVALHVAARSPQPVVVVPRRRPNDPPDRPAAAVLGVGDRDDDEAVATFAAQAAGQSAGLTVLQTRPPRRAVPDSWVDDGDEWRRRYPELSVTRSELPGARADRLLAATCPASLLVISAGTGGLLHRRLDGLHRWLMRHCTSPMALIPPVHRSVDEPREESTALG